MRIKIKKLHDDATIPKYAHYGDAAVDLTAIRQWEDNYGNLCYGTGIAIEIPGYREGIGLFAPQPGFGEGEVI